MGDGWLTIGIEEEFQIVDESGELRAHIVPLVARAASTSLDELRPEMMQSVVEVATRVCFV